jgi:uncharacterized membrane protein
VCVGCHRTFTASANYSRIRETYGRVEIHWADRALTVVLSVAVVSYVAFGVWIGELPIPGFKPQYDTTFFYGTAAWLMAAAALCMVFCWVSFFARSTMPVERALLHEYPTAEFKPRYPMWWRGASILGWAFFVAALIAHVLDI